MFDSLTDRLGDIFDRLRKSANLSEADVGKAMREVRVALLEADVALPVVKSFIDRAKRRAVGKEVLRSVTPGQMVIKIVHDELVDMLSGGAEIQDTDALSVNAPTPVPILMVGLQGSGKTTTTAKVGLHLHDKARKKVLMVSLDTHRPAAQEQLRVLGQQAGIDTLPVIEGQNPLDIAKRGMTAAKLSGYDVVLLDTAGRMAADEVMMTEVAEIEKASNPHETLLVVDSLTGQDAVNVAENFRKRIKLTGVILTRIDGDGRGGAALSMRAVTGCPIKLLGTGEKLDALENFHADRIANRILGMGDVVSLVEKATQAIDQKQAQKLTKKMAEGTFDLNDLAEQLRQMRKIGGMQGMLSMLPGVGKVQKQLADAALDDKVLIRQEALIGSMTPRERANPKLLNGSRKRRIAAGAGLAVQDVNKLVKMCRQMSDMMKRMDKMGKKGLLGDLTGGAPDPGMSALGLPGLRGARLPPAAFPPGSTKSKNKR